MNDISLRARSWTATAVNTRPMPIALPRDGILAALMATVAFAVLSATLGHGFVNWDDYHNFLENPHYRGLGWNQLQWMAQSVHMGHWIPVTWLTFGLDYVLWGVDPFGYHLTNLGLHAANAALFFVIAVRLLTLAVDNAPAGAVRVGAGVAALAFAVHPLRVESVAWVTERRDVLSGLFALVTVLAYVRAREPGSVRPTTWRIVSLVAFYLAIMSKSIVVTIPFVLLLLDFYPLRRVTWGRWRQMRLAVSDKLPYVPIAGIGAGLALMAGRLNGIFTTLDGVSTLDRIGLAAHSAWFYLSRSLVPVGLSPLHGLPASTSLWQPRFLVSLLAMLLIAAIAIGFASRWPGLLVALLAYLAVLAPVSGALQNGHQLVAERYSYLSCLSWALLLGGVAAASGVAARGTAIRRRGVAGVVAVWLVALSAATVNQTSVWRDSETLWRATVAADASCSVCHYLYGLHLRLGGHPGQAFPHFVQALSLKPTPRMLGQYLAQAALSRQALGDAEGAAADLEALRRLSPELAQVTGLFMVTSW